MDGRRLHDDEAVSPVIGTILMVAITVVVGGLVFVVATQFSGQRGDVPEVVFVFDDRGGASGGILTVSRIEHGPLEVTGLALGGTSHGAAPCAWSRASGPLQVGDQLMCSEPGTITVTDSTSQILLYSGSFR